MSTSCSRRPGRPSYNPRIRRPVLTLATCLALAVTTLWGTDAASASKSAAARPCFGKVATKLGTPRADVFWGTRGDDVIVALGGDDVVHSSPGRDRVCAGPGDDRVAGGAGVDRLAGGLDRDTVRGGGGKDLVEGGAGRDRLAGGPGRDRATYASASRGIRADLGAGTARGHGGDSLAGVDGLIGSRFADTLIGGAGPNLLRGSVGPDALLGRGGRDAIHGGGGTDGCVQGVGGGVKRDCEVVAFAQVHSLLVFEPHRRTVGFGFHEALHGASLVLHPLGRLRLNDNRSRYPHPPPATDGPAYVVMGSRGRPTHPMSAIDLVVPSSARIRAPVSGTVVEVDTYLLYCRIRDWKVIIRPRSHRDLRVLVLHLARPLVRKGDTVVAGASAIGISAQNDASWAQENDYFPDRYPHVHVEIERKDARKPPCAA